MKRDRFLDMLRERQIQQLWQNLNQRQQHYLQCIYRIDREVEQAETQKSWYRGERKRPAAEWRWLRYGYPTDLLYPTPLKNLLQNEGLVDEGTGSTFKALSRREAILHREVTVRTIGRKACRRRSTDHPSRSRLCSLRFFRTSA